jgi:hypothetical protein
LWHSPCPEQLSAQVPFQAIIPNLTSRDNGFCVVSFIILPILLKGTSNSALWQKKEHFMLITTQNSHKKDQSIHNINSVWVRRMEIKTEKKIEE